MYSMDSSTHGNVELLVGDVTLCSKFVVVE